MSSRAEGRSRAKAPRKKRRSRMSGLKRMAEKHSDIPTNTDEQPRRSNRDSSPPRRSPVREKSRSPVRETRDRSRSREKRDRSHSGGRSRDRPAGGRSRQESESSEEELPRDREGMLDQRERFDGELEKIRQKMKAADEKRQYQISQAQKFTEKLREHLMKEKAKKDDIGDQLEDREKERQAMMGESKEVEQELEDLKDRIEELDDDMDKINQYDLEFDCKSVQSLEDLCTDASKDITVVSNQVKDLKKESDRLHDELEDEEDDLHDVEQEKEDIRAEEDRIIEKCNQIIQDYKEKFSLKDYAKMASEAEKRGGLSSWFSKKSAPMSNEKKSLCKETIRDVQAIMECVTRELHPNNGPKSSSKRNVNLELRGYIMHNLTQVGDNIVTFNEMLIDRFNDLGDKATYDVMRYLEEELDFKNQKLRMEGEAENGGVGDCAQQAELEEELRQLKSERDFTKQCLDTFKSQLVAYKDEAADNQKRLEKIHKKKRLLSELRMTKQEYLKMVRQNEEMEKTAQNRIKKSSAMFWESYRGSHRNINNAGRGRRGSRSRSNSRSRSPANRKAGRTDDGSGGRRGGERKAKKAEKDGTRVYSDGEISDSDSDTLEKDRRVGETQYLSRGTISRLKSLDKSPRDRASRTRGDDFD